MEASKTKENLLPPACPACLGALFCVGGSDLEVFVGQRATSESVESYRCADLEGCSGGLEHLPRINAWFTVDQNGQPVLYNH